VIAMANGAIAGGKSCVVTVQVKADVPGTFINAVAASAVNGGTATPWRRRCRFGIGSACRSSCVRRARTSSLVCTSDRAPLSP
jgi:hypothetical protein